MSAKYLVAAMMAVAVAAPLSAQSVKAGIDAWQRADYAGAIAIWRPLAEGGDADAQFNLGQAYRLGRGVPLDLAAAKVWFERAARSGHLDAQTTLGLLTFQNGDRAAGLKWLKAAADQGEPRALLVYGTALYNGDGVPQDRVLGYAYVSRAAAQGLEPAQETLAQLDKLMPVAERQKAVALAQAKARQAPPPLSRPQTEAREGGGGQGAPHRSPPRPTATSPAAAAGASSSALSRSAGRRRRSISVCRAKPRSPGGALIMLRAARSPDSRSAVRKQSGGRSRVRSDWRVLLPCPGQVASDGTNRGG